MKHFRTAAGRLYLAQDSSDDPRLQGRFRVVEAALVSQGGSSYIVSTSTPVEYPDTVDLVKEFSFTALDAAKPDEKKLIDATSRAIIPSTRGMLDLGANILPQL